MSAFVSFFFFQVNSVIVKNKKHNSAFAAELIWDVLDFQYTCNQRSTRKCMYYYVSTRRWVHVYLPLLDCHHHSSFQTAYSVILFSPQKTVACSITQNFDIHLKAHIEDIAQQTIKGRYLLHHKLKDIKNNISYMNIFSQILFSNKISLNKKGNLENNSCFTKKASKMNVELLECLCILSIKQILEFKTESKFCFSWPFVPSLRYKTKLFIKMGVLKTYLGLKYPHMGVYGNTVTLFDLFVFIQNLLKSQTRINPVGILFPHKHCVISGELTWKLAIDSKPSFLKWATNASWLLLFTGNSSWTIKHNCNLYCI